MANLLFYLMGAGAVATAFGVVGARNPIMSVLSLLGSFFCLAVIYLLAGFQFMAAAQILVYAGAVMVLFLFVIMLLNLGGLSRERWLDKAVLRERRLPLILAICAGVLILALVAGAAADAPKAEAGSVETLEGLATVLFGRFLLAFEASSILLLAAALAVLVLAKRQRGPTETPRSVEGLRPEGTQAP